MRKRTASVTVCFILLVSCFMTVKADGPAIEPYSSTIFSNYIASATCPSAGKISGSIYVAIRDDVKPATLAGLKYTKLQYKNADGTWTTERIYPQAYFTGCNSFSKEYNNLTVTSGRTYRFKFTAYGVAGGTSSERVYYSNSVYIK